MVECVQLRSPVNDCHTLLSAMHRSLLIREVIQLKMYDPHEELFIEGVIDFLDPIAGKFGVDGECFDIDKVVGLIG